MVYVETGRTSIQLSIQKRMVNFWLQLNPEKQTKLSVALYKLMTGLHDGQSNNFKSECLIYVQSIFSKGFNNVWNIVSLLFAERNQVQVKNYINWLKKTLNLRLNDILSRME